MIRKSFLFLLLFISIATLAQEIKISGYVSNTMKQPLEFVTISSSNSTRGIYTDKKGYYELNISSTDSVKVLFSLVGYQQRQYIYLKPEKDIELNILLEEDNILNPVTIEGSRIVTTVIERIDYLATKRASNPFIGIEGLLVTMGGVSTNNELSSQYSVRGGNFDENIVYVNGIEIYRPLLVRSAQQEGLSFINPNMVQTVGFSAGGYSAEYGDKMSSVLDIKYKRPSTFEASVSTGLMGSDAYIGSSSGRFSQVTGVRYKTIRSLMKTTDTKAEYDPSFLDLQTYITYDITPKWEVNFLGNYSLNRYEFTPKTRETSFGTLLNPRTFKVGFEGWEKDRFLTYQAALTVKGKVSNNINIGLTGSTFSSDEQERYDITGRYVLQEPYSYGQENTDTDSEGVIGIGTYHNHARNNLQSEVATLTHFGDFRLGKNLLKWSASIQKERIEDKIREWEMRDSAGFSLPNYGNEVDLYSNLKSSNDINSTRFSGYLQDTYTIETEKGYIILNAGVRGSYWNFNDEFIISPRGALTFVPANHENLSFRIAGGVYYQAPFYKELQRIVLDDNNNNITQLNKNIKSQKSYHLVLGTDYYFRVSDNKEIPPFKLSGEIYYKKLSNLIPYTVNNVKIRYSGENSASGYAMGIDTKLYGEFIPGSDSWISLSFMKAEQKIAGKNVPLPTDQRFNLALFYQDYIPSYDRLKMSLRGLWSQGLPNTAPYKGYEYGYFRTPSYKRVDLGFSWLLLGENFSIRNRSSFCKAFKNIWIGLDVFNIFDMQNTNTYYWITDVYGQQSAIPNYLTGRQLNVRLLAEF